MDNVQINKIQKQKFMLRSTLFGRFQRCPHSSSMTHETVFYSYNYGAESGVCGRRIHVFRAFQTRTL